MQAVKKKVFWCRKIREKWLLVPQNSFDGKCHKHTDTVYFERLQNPNIRKEVKENWHSIQEKVVKRKKSNDFLLF